MIGFYKVRFGLVRFIFFIECAEVRKQDSKTETNKLKYKIETKENEKQRTPPSQQHTARDH